MWAFWEFWAPTFAHFHTVCSQIHCQQWRMSTTMLLRNGFWFNQRYVFVFFFLAVGWMPASSRNHFSIMFVCSFFRSLRLRVIRFSLWLTTAWLALVLRSCENSFSRQRGRTETFSVFFIHLKNVTFILLSVQFLVVQTVFLVETFLPTFLRN